MMIQYIKFNAPGSRPERETGLLKKTASGFLSLFIPGANPAFEKLYSHVKYWMIEIGEDGKPYREIGFDESNLPIVAGPWRENLGVWTDSDHNSIILPNSSMLKRSMKIFLKMHGKFLKMLIRN